jgi:hypothetical protein
MSNEKHFLEVKKEILDALDLIELKNFEAADYMRKHIVFDDKKFTIKYTGDDRVSIKKVFGI